MSRTRRRHAIQILLILAAATVLYLIGNGRVPLWDRDEPRYAQTSRQMLRSGDWVVPRLLDEVRTAKPVFIYWCQAAAMRAFGENEFAARLPSAVAMLLTLLFLAIIIWRTIGPRRAGWTTIVLASSALVIAEAKLCITDAVLLLWVMIAQVCLATTYGCRTRGPAHCKLASGHDRGLIGSTDRGVAAPLVMWTAIALAGLTKGPVVLGILVMTMIALAVFDVGRDWRSARGWLDAIRWWRLTRPLAGIVIIALICGPWLYLIERRTPGFLRTSIGHDVITRMRTGLEGHTGPPGYYLASIWLTFFPWSLLLPATIVLAWRRRANPIHRFCLAAVVGPWVMFELVQTKLVHYLLPVFPPLALLTADMLVRTARRATNDLNSRGFLAVVRVWCVVVALVGLLPWLSLRYFDLPRAAVVAMVLLTLLCAAYGWLVYRHFRAGRARAAAEVMGVGMMLVIAVLFGAYLPHATFLQISPRVAQVLWEHGAVDRGDAIMIDYREDSLAFYQGGTIRRERDKSYLLNTPRAAWPMWVVLTDAVWKTMPPAVREEFDEVARVRGWWYVKGRVVEVIVLRKKTPFALRAPVPPRTKKRV